MAEQGGGVMERALSSLQIAALLVSASYGIGFLFGTGELALAHGMAGSIYGIATAFGMLALAAVARPLWSSGLSVWDLFGKAYGAHLRKWVAVLSLVWMAGVLAAQIHGGVAVARLLGLADPFGLLVVVSLIFVASRMNLQVASGVFSACLLASGLVLIYALFVSGGVERYAQAVPAFVADMDTFRPTQFWTVSLAVCLLVVTGADYHQFLMSGQSARNAVMGCVLAGIALLLIAFLPSAVVLAMLASGALMDMPDGKQVIPWVLSQVAGTMAESLGLVMLLALSLAALGSGAAILRAMGSALSAALPKRYASQPWMASAVALFLGALLATREQGIVETMVSVNIIYLASIGVCFSALLANIRLSPEQARSTMAAGLVVSGGIYAAGCMGLLDERADTLSLILGWLVSASVAVVACLRGGHDRRDVTKSCR
jgi:solute:Na+ symporter, SSS family